MHVLYWGFPTLQGTFKNWISVFKGSFISKHAQSFAVGNLSFFILNALHQLDISFKIVEGNIICIIYTRFMRYLCTIFYLCAMFQQHRLNMTNRFCRVQPFRTDADTVHDAMTAENAERIIQSIQS